jgi:hypothetical protein
MLYQPKYNEKRPEMSQYFDSLDGLLRYAKSTKNDYLIKATENTIKNGYKISK